MDNSLKQYMKMKNMNEAAIKLSVLRHQPKITNKINLNNRLEVLVNNRFISVKISGQNFGFILSELELSKFVKKLNDFNNCNIISAQHF